MIGAGRREKVTSGCGGQRGSTILPIFQRAVWTRGGEVVARCGGAAVVPAVLIFILGNTVSHKFLVCRLVLDIATCGMVPSFWGHCLACLRDILVFCPYCAGEVSVGALCSRFR